MKKGGGKFLAPGGQTKRQGQAVPQPAAPKGDRRKQVAATMGRIVHRYQGK